MGLISRVSSRTYRDKKTIKMRFISSFRILFTLFFVASCVYGFGMSAGGVSEQSLEDGKEHAEAAHKYAMSKALLSDSCDYKISEITKFTSQVVSGIMYKVEYALKSDSGCDSKNCQASIWSQPWLGDDKIDVDC